MISKLKKSQFIKSVVIMATGTIGAQVITMAMSPIITRLFGPEAFGLMGAFNSFVNILIPLVALTYPVAIVLPKNNIEAIGLIRLSLFIVTITTCLSIIAIYLFNNKIIHIFKLEEIAQYVYLIPLVILLSGIVQILENWLIRNQQYKLNAKTTFYQALILNSGKVGVGLLYPFAGVLILFSSITSGIKIFLIFLQVNKRELLNILKPKFNFSSLKDLAKKYYDFPLYRAPETFLSTVSQSLPVILLTAFFGAASAGFYTIGRTVLFMPSLLIGKAIEDVFYPKIAKMNNDGKKLTKVILQATLGLLIIGIIPFGLIIVWGPAIFGFVFGSDWAMAGEYAKWVALWTFSSFIVRPSVRSLAVLNAQRFHLIFTFIMTITRLFLIYFGFSVYANDLIAIALFGVSGAVFNIILIIITINISSKRNVIKI
ncbi:lipopolysaccharide biosynthesis protein [Ornithinibacillus sp. 4-3]|uniref:Lipopolysaccharide biosynthesis protein n=1 Tax=Ornithinibacillus sp. 4-3 TaxID=3231488 RepID=A0AB39HL99_9BACI